MAVKTPDTREEQDSAYSPEQLKNAEQVGGGYASAGADQAEAFANDPKNSTDSNTKNIDDALDKESNPMNFSGSGASGKSGGGRFLGTRKKSASLFITLGLLGGGFGVSFLGAPGLLLVQMKEIFTNYGSSTSRAAVPRYNKMLRYMIGDNSKVDKACASNPTGKKCTLGTMSDQQKSSYEKAKFKINGETINGRTRVVSVEFPDGKVVKNGNDFIKYTRKNIAAASAARVAHNPGTKIFNGGRFSSKVLTKFGQTKEKKVISGDTDEEKKKSFNDHVGSSESDDERNAKFRAKYESSIKTNATKASRVSGAAAIACAAFNISKATITAVKIENGVRFVGFAMLFLNAADQIKTQGAIEPETASMLGGVLTSTATTGAKAGLAATDSQGYKIAAYGGEGALAKFTQAFLLGGNPSLIKVDETIRYLQDDIMGGRKNVRTLCRSASNLFLAAALGLTICAAQVAAGTVGGTIIPVAGNIFGFFTSVAACVVQIILTGVFLGYAINFMVEKGMGYAIEMLSNAKLDVNKISSVDAGNAMAVGSGVLLGTTATSRGLKAGNKDDVTTFLAATAEDQSLTDEIAMYDARKEPFNAYNQYSFLGSTLRKTGIMLRAPTSVSEGLSNIGTILRSSSLLTPSAHATPNSMPVNITKADLSDCPDRDMKEIGIDCDKMGVAQFVLSQKELDMEVSDNLEYMIDDHKFVDEEGEVIDENSTYAKWLVNCTEQRDAPMGSTMLAIEDDDYDWGTGENCVGEDGDGAASEEDLSNFRVYYNSNAEKEDGDYVPTENVTDTENGFALRAASFNIFHSADQADPVWKARLTKSMNVLASNNVGIAGLQEVRRNQLQALQTSEFSVFGSDITYETHPKTFDRSPNPVIWNNQKYKLIKADSITVKYGGGSQQIPLLKMQDIASGSEFYFINTHDPADSQGTAQDRLYNANIYKGKLEEISKEGLPIIFAGDFNSSYTTNSANKPVGGLRSNLTYCILTRSGDFWNASDAFQNKTGECPSEKAADGKNRPDHIFVNSNLSVSNYITSPAGRDKNGSDVHDTVIADVVIPGFGGLDTQAGKPVWPLDKKWYDLNKSDWLGSHGSTGTAWGGDNMGANGKGPYIAADIGDPPVGSPVYAMLGGTVTSTNLCGSNDGIAIKSIVDGKTLGVSYMHGGNKKFKAGDTVKAGEHIMDIGEIGCNVEGAHLHMGVAYDGDYLCPQDVFLAIDKSETPNWGALTQKAASGGSCGR